MALFQYGSNDDWQGWFAIYVSHVGAPAGSALKWCFRSDLHRRARLCFKLLLGE